MVLLIFYLTASKRMRMTATQINAVRKSKRRICVLGNTTAWTPPIRSKSNNAQTRPVGNPRSTSSWYWKINRKEMHKLDIYFFLNHVLIIDGLSINAMLKKSADKTLKWNCLLKIHTQKKLMTFSSVALFVHVFCSQRIITLGNLSKHIFVVCLLYSRFYSPLMKSTLKSSCVQIQISFVLS